MADSLLLIPDISGFTDFVNRTEITHSQHIISELLEIIIRNQSIGMEVAEVEGDAVLFYKEDSQVNIRSILHQSEQMFLKFHRHLMEYERNRICNCGACSSASQLSLKFIVHSAEIGFTTVNNNKKPFGPGLVLIHRLLKNKINLQEYILFTENLYPAITDYEGKDDDSQIKFIDGSENYETIGKINYKYLDYSFLLHKVGEVDPPVLNKLSSNPVIYEDVIKTSIDKVYEILSNLDYRLKWQPGIKELKYEKNRINRAGTKHICVFTGSKYEFETISRHDAKENMIYGEKLSNKFFNREISVYYILENDDPQTKIRIEIHFDPLPVFGHLMLPLIKYQFKKAQVKSFKSLKKYCEHN
jgi:hypothetical protein